MVTIAEGCSDCCLKTVEHTGKARGTIETIAGIPTYISAPSKPSPSPRKIILFFADVYGPFLLNSQLIMDFWAESGYLVLALDYFEGDAIDKYAHIPGFSGMQWAGPKYERSLELTPRWLKTVRERYDGPGVKWVCAGYCFGAPFVMNCLKNDWLSAGAFAHPAYLTDDHFKDAIKPVFISCAEEDALFPAESRRDAVDILAQKKTTYQVQLFSTVGHGFALRGDLKNPFEMYAKEKSAEGMLAWFNLFTA